jgi:hypothetical protein
MRSADVLVAEANRNLGYHEKALEIVEGMQLQPPPLATKALVAAADGDWKVVRDAVNGILSGQFNGMMFFHPEGTRLQIRDCEHSSMTKIYHPLLALIASATESELAKCVESSGSEGPIRRPLCRRVDFYPRLRVVLSETPGARLGHLWRTECPKG